MSQVRRTPLYTAIPSPTNPTSTTIALPPTLLPAPVLVNTGDGKFCGGEDWTIRGKVAVKGGIVDESVVGGTGMG